MVIVKKMSWFIFLLIKPLTANEESHFPTAQEGWLQIVIHNLVSPTWFHDMSWGPKTDA